MTSQLSQITSYELVPKPGSFLLPWISRSLEALWLVAVFLVPLTFLNKDYAISEAQIANLEVPKVALLRILAGFIAILWSIEWAIKSQKPEGPSAETITIGLANKLRPVKVFSGLVAWLSVHPIRWLLFAAGLFFGSTFISTVLSASFMISMWGEVPGQDGYSAYTIASYGILFGVIASHLKSSTQFGRLFTAIILMGVIVGTYGILQHFNHDFLGLTETSGGGSNRVTIFMGNAIFAGALLSMTIPFTLLAGSICTQKTTTMDWRPLSKIGLHTFATLVCSLLLAIQLLGLIFTFSRGTWSGAVLALVAFLVLILVSLGWQTLVRTGLILALAGILSVAFLHWQGSVTIINGGPWLGFLLALLGVVGTFSTIFIIEKFSRAIILFAFLGIMITVGGGWVVAPSALTDLNIDPDSNNETGETTTLVAQRITSIKTDVLGGFAGGRSTHWKASWELIKERPWFAFDDISLSWLRPIVGYGPDLFRYTYLLRSPPDDYNSLPLEPDHAHNFFIHHLVEQGIIGVIASSAVFLSVFCVAAHHLVRKRQDGSPAYRLLILGLTAIILGRFLEMMVGVARISDLTVLWALLALFAAIINFEDKPKKLSTVNSTADLLPKNTRRRRRTRIPKASTSRFLSTSLLFRLAIVAWLAGGIGVVSWQKSVNSVRASVAEGKAIGHFNEGRLEESVKNLEKAIELAPTISAYHNNLSQIYLAYLLNPNTSTDPDCAQRSSSEEEYRVCLGIKSLESNLEAVNQQPFDYRARIAAGNSAFNLNQKQTALELYAQGSGMVPYSWPIRETLSESLIQAGRYEEAISELQRSLQITGGSNPSSTAKFLIGQSLYELKRPEEALGMLKSEFNFKPTSETLNLINRINEDLGVRTDIEHFNTLIEQNPEDMTELYLRGLAYLARGDYEKALIDVDKSLASGFSNDTAMNLARGYLRLKLGYPTQDLFDLVEAVTANPNNPLFNVYRAQYEIARGHHAEAMIYLENANILDPSLGLAYLSRSKLLMELGIEDIAKSELDISSKLHLQTTQDYVDRAVIHSFFGEYELAFADFEEALLINPSQSKTYDSRGKIHAITGNLSSALTDFNTAISLDPNNSQFYLNRSVVFNMLGLNERSSEDYTQAMSIDKLNLPLPESVDASYFEVYTDLTTPQEKHWKYTDLQAEIATLKKSKLFTSDGFDIAPDHAHYMRSLQILGEARLASQMWPDAIVKFTELINASPNTPETYRYRGDAYVALGRFNEAIKDYSKAIDLRFTDVAPFLARAKAYLGMENFELADSDFDTAIQLDPLSSEVYKERGYASVLSKNYSAAFPDINRSIELNPLDYDSFLKRAQVYIGLEENLDALNDLEHAISLAPGDAETYYTRGLLKFNLNDYHGAINDLSGAIALSKRFRNMDPKNSLAYTIRGRAHLLTGRADLALDDAQTLIEVVSNNFLPKEFLDGRIQDDWKSKRNEITKMFIDTHRLKGDAFTELNQIGQATDAYRIALSIK